MDFDANRATGLYPLVRDSDVRAAVCAMQCAGMRDEEYHQRCPAVESVQNLGRGGYRGEEKGEKDVAYIILLILWLSRVVGVGGRVARTRARTNQFILKITRDDQFSGPTLSVAVGGCGRKRSFNGQGLC